MDTEIYLKPITDVEPVGKYLRWEKEYEELEEARRADDDTANDDVWRRELKRADWARVIDLATQILRDKSKDLQVAAMLCEAWAHLHGLAGISDGLELMLAIQSRFWEHAYPDCSDPELRRGVYEFLDDSRLLPARIRSVPLTRIDGAPQLSYSLMKYKEALNTDKEYAKAENDKKRSLLEGNLRSADFDEAAASTPRSYYVDLVEALQSCRAKGEELNEHLRAKWPATPGERPPQFSQVLTALEEVETVAKRLLARKPAPAVVEETSAADELASTTEKQFTPETNEELHSDAPPTATASQSHKPRNSPARLDTADDAYKLIAQAAHFLRHADAADPTPYLVLRALQAGRLYGADGLFTSGKLVPPASETRQRLHQMSTSADGGQASDLLEESEQALSRPEGRGWLDPHAYSAQSLETLGHTDVAQVCAALLSIWIRDHQQWPDAQLDDGTPCASQKTKDWIQRACLIDAPQADSDIAAQATIQRQDRAAISLEPGNGSPSDPDSALASTTIWDQAQVLCRDGRLNEAIALMVQAVRMASSGRERFLRTLEQAELFLWCNRPNLALPLLELLAQRIDELHLDEWEDASLCARVLSRLFECIRGRDDSRAAAIYSRLCQIDPGEALLLGEVGSAGTTDVNLKNGITFKKRSNRTLGKTDTMSS
jgi:type VI secretion system ImpA family protein